MRLCHSSILIFTCLACLGIDTIPASTATTRNLAPKILELAQASSTNSATRAILGPNSTGKDVEVLQTQLKELGYYDGVINGQYDVTTRIALSKFQKAKGLSADGIVGKTTWDTLQASIKQKSASSPATTPPPQTSKKQNQSQNSLVWWLLIASGVLGSLGALLYLMRFFRNIKKISSSPTLGAEPYIQTETKPAIASLQEFNTTTNGHSNNTAVVSPEETTASPTKLLPPEKTSRLAKVNIIDELITDLNSSDPTKRRKAIWDLGQQGDSRAIQPLVDIMIDADSQQRSLILAALSEIGSRALKPMNRALAISLQDESPDVRKNAIRDLTRVYDMMAQISQMLCHAAEDSDTEVQATARYALSQMNRIRALPSQEILPEDSQENPES
jgi:peptidoglycan hydrolase-like protein with peptidoglycan-binding domain